LGVRSSACTPRPGIAVVVALANSGCDYCPGGEPSVRSQVYPMGQHWVRDWQYSVVAHSSSVVQCA
jgi:hypothetical protein